jgi:tetratricopeptide (TPR) repeat protein
MQRATAIACVAVWIAVVSRAAGGSSTGVTPATVLALESWVQAVKTHTPGRADQPVVVISALSFETREAMNAGMSLFFAALMGKHPNSDGNQAKRMVVDIGLTAGSPTAEAFLTKAVGLHSDAAIYGYLLPRESASSSDTKHVQADPQQRAPLVGARSLSPLLRRNRLVLEKDGQILGDVASNWNWAFARALLDRLSRTDISVAGAFYRLSQTDESFAGGWYHATTAYMFASGQYGEATAHLQHAAGMLPDDARILFDRACYAEMLGLPMQQVLVSREETLLRRGSGGPVGTWNGRDLHIPPAEKTNSEAERLFRRALKINPGIVEARVRLARLLDLRNRHQEAAAELTTAFATNPTGMVAFYAHLFAGRAAQALGRLEEARHHYEEAGTLFPDAQSALLASSQVALLGSDVPAALAPLQRLGAASAAVTADPWWHYHLCAGRDAESLLKELWAGVPR